MPNKTLGMYLGSTGQEGSAEIVGFAREAVVRSLSPSREFLKPNETPPPSVECLNASLVSVEKRASR